MSTASNIRQFLDDLFYSKLVYQLERDLIFARADADRLRTDYKDQIAELRSDKEKLLARLAMHEAKMGLREPSAVPLRPNFGVDFSVPLPETSWQRQVREHDEKIAKELKEEEEARSKVTA